MEHALHACCPLRDVDATAASKAQDLKRPSRRLPDSKPKKTPPPHPKLQVTRCTPQHPSDPQAQPHGGQLFTSTSRITCKSAAATAASKVHD